MPHGFDLGEWVDGLTDICDAIAGGAGEAAVLRKLHCLLSKAPPEVQADLAIASTSAAIEQLLEDEARREVAFRLLGRASYMISRGRSGAVKATIVTGNVIAESDGEGESEAQAICSALVGGLLDWSRRSGFINSPGATAH